MPSENPYSIYQEVCYVLVVSTGLRMILVIVVGLGIKEVSA
jgi:hypothetical protein